MENYFFLLVVEKIFWIKNRAQNEVLPGSIFCNSAFSFTKLNRVYFAPREYFPGTKYVAEMNLLLKLYYIGRWKFRINIICIHTVMFDISPENISKIVKVMPRENNRGKSHFLLLRFLHVMIHRYFNNLRTRDHSSRSSNDLDPSLRLPNDLDSRINLETLIPFLE